MNVINFNGKLLPKSEPLFTIENRAFRYGDGLFESILGRDEHFPLLELHFDRIKNGMQYLFMDIPETFTPDFLQTELLKLPRNTRRTRYRLQIFRKAGGRYTPQINEWDYLIEAEPLPGESWFTLNEQGLAVDLIKRTRLAQQTNPFKTINAIPYIRAGVEKKQLNVDEGILLNDQRRVAETVSSNIYIVRKEKIFTPPLSSGCLHGVFRQWMLMHQKELRLSILEKKIKLMDLFKADEVWVSNAVQGLQAVSRFREKTYDRLTITRTVKSINDYLDAVKPPSDPV